MKKSGSLRRACYYLLALLVLCCPLAALAQNITGTIHGTVLDSSGAVVPNATVIILNDEQGREVRRLKTDANGNYTAPQLQIGTYTVSAEATGFKKIAVQAIKLNVNEMVSVPLTLQIGSASETISVKAMDLQISTDSPTASTLISGTQIVGLPLNNRNYEQLVALQPGVAYGGGDQLYIGATNPSGQTNVVSFSINGQRSSANNWTVDGASNVDRGSNYTLLIYPSIDAIAEFKTLRNTYSAEFGQSASGQINLVTKSGTNTFHGDLHEFNRNDAFAANTATNKISKIKRPPYRYNNYGYTFGGPVLLPKIYDGRDKTFFFFSQEFRRVITYSPLLLVGDPTADMRNGIFPTPVCVQLNAAGTACASKSTTITNIDPTAQAYLKDIYSHVPTGNYTADATGTTLVTTARNVYNETQEIGRLDHNFGTKLGVFFRIVDDDIPTIEPSGLFTNASGFPGVNTTQSDAPGKNYLGHFLWTVSPTFLVDGGYAYSYGAILSKPTGLMGSANSPDVRPTLPFTSNLPRIPSVTFTGGTSLTSYGPYKDYSRDHNPYVNVSKIVGRHSLRTGFAYHHYEKTENSASTNAGIFGFTTTGAPSGVPSFYQSFAWFLLGANASFSQTSLDLTPDMTTNQWEAYIQDDWKVTPRFTVNAGVRYSIFQQPKDENKMLTSFDPTSWSAAAAPAIDSKGNICTTAPCSGGATPNPNYNTLNGVIVAGTSASKYGDHVAPQAYKNVAPRVGFSWDVYGNGKTALRGGYGIAYDASLVGDFEQNIFQNVPYVQSVNINSASLSNPLSGTVSVSSLPKALRATPYQGSTPYSQQFSLDVQQQLAPNLVLDMSYVGSRGTHLLGLVDLNQPQPGAYRSLGIATVTRSNTALLNQIRPYKGWDAINAVEPWFNSNYHSFQVALQKRFQDGSLFDVNYTWSKALTDNQSDRSSAVQNIYNIPGEYGPAQYDRRNMFNADFVYSLPFFRAQSGWVGHTLGGWQLSGLVYMNGGLPLTVTTTADPAGLGLLDSASSAGARPNQTGNPNSGVGIHTRSLWFNKSVFQDVPAGGALAGNEHRGAVRGPGWQRWDLALYKNFKLGQRVTTQLRAESTNTFNHTNLDSVSVSSTSATYGQITGYRDPRIVQFGAKLDF